MILFSITLLIFLVSTTSNCQAETIDNTTVDEFDLSRYMGKWYEIARFDNRFERNLSEVTAEYILNEDDHVIIINRGFNTKDMEWREARGKGHPTEVNGQLNVSFFMFFSTEYNVMGLGDNYEWALVGSKSSKYLWILSRTPMLSSGVMEHILSLARSRGYDVEELTLVQHEDVA